MKRNDLLLVLVPTLLFVIFWMGFNVYHNSQSSTISETVNMQINPINPTFDNKTIDLLKTRIQITPTYQVNPGSISTPSATPIVTPAPTVTVNPQQASTGGSLTP